MYRSGRNDMATAIVFHDDWHSNEDPVPYYGDDPEGCYDERHKKTIARAKLKLNTVKYVPDCNHPERGQQVVVCDVVE
jgi:hypothetical protein